MTKSIEPKNTLVDTEGKIVEFKESIYTKLAHIQNKLDCPKNRYNQFGKFKYRSCEDILEALKPHLKEMDCVVIEGDAIINKGERYYVEATCELIDCKSGEKIKNTAYAREIQEKSGMDESQLTGVASTYARKYALNGMFLIDDTQDADTMNNTITNKPTQTVYKKETVAIPKQSDTKDVICDKCKSKMLVTKYPDKNGNLYYYCTNKECKHKYWPPKQTAGEKEFINTFDATEIDGEGETYAQHYDALKRE